MNKKIRAIEVLNEMANDESYRPTVKYQEMTYTYNYDIGDYTNDFNSEYGIFSGWALNLMLNNEVEILEDNTEEIEEIPEISDEYFNMLSDEAKVKWLKSYIKEDRNKINELVKVVKEIRKDLNK